MTSLNFIAGFCRSKVLLLSVLAVLFIPVFGFSQISATRFRHVSYEQGLSNTTILCITQDSRGFMWFGTRDGLNRYDGVNVTVYKNNPHVSSSIRDNFIRCIYEAADHTLWIGTSYGLASFDPKSDKFTRYWHSYRGKRAGDDIITSICDDAQHNLWISTLDSGIYRLDGKTKYFSHFSHSNKAGSISSDSVNYIFKDAHSQIWVGTANGLNSLDAKTGKFKVYRQADRGANSITCISEDNAGRLWMGTTASGLVVFDHGSFKTLKHNDNDPNSLSSNLVISVLADKKGNIWAGTDGGGMNMYDAAKGTFYQYTPVPDNSNSLSNLTVSALYEDVQGNLWIGTHRGGVNMYSAGMDKFKLFREGVATNTLSYDDVKAFFQDAQGNIWVGTDGGGLNLFDKKTGTFKRYQYDARNPKSLSSNAVQAIAADAQGNLWIGTWGGGLNMMDKNTGEFTHFRNDTSKTSLSSDFLQRLFLDSKGNFWVATYYGGLNLWNPKTHNFTRVTKDSTGKTSFSGKDVVSIGEDHDGNVWFGTDDGGLNKYSLATKTFSHYFDQEEKKTDSRVLFTDSKGRLWLGQAGLFLFDKASNSFKLYSHKCGLDTNFIKGMAEGKHHNLWVSTSNGLVKLYPSNGDAVLFNTSDGLQGMEFEANSYMTANDGEMYFGGINGFNAFYPDNIKVNQFVPHVYITGLQFFNKTVKPGAADSILKEDVSYEPEFSVNHRFNSVSFTFAALNYINSANNQYKYKLEGFDTTWTEAGAEHKAVYTNLDPGTYVFRVIASNNDGVWNEKGASIMFTIEKPVWTRWWFRIIVLAIIVSIIYSYNRYTVNDLRR
jgi:ligand-binding sensor domain-containing protein